MKEKHAENEVRLCFVFFFFGSPKYSNAGVAH